MKVRLTQEVFSGCAKRAGEVIGILAHRSHSPHKIGLRARAGPRPPREAAWQRGQSLIEFALILPVITWVLLGVVDLGRVYHLHMVVTNASRVGAEFAMDPRRSISETVTAIKRDAAPIEIADSDVSLIASPSWAAGNQLTVEVRTQFEAVTPLISGLWGDGPLTLVGQTITRFNSP